MNDRALLAAILWAGDAIRNALWQIDATLEKRERYSEAWSFAEAWEAVDEFLAANPNKNRPA